MTTYNKSTLKTFFQTGDVPTGTDYANFIDSYVNLVETAEQTMAGNLNTTKLVTPIVSATDFNTSGNIICAGDISAANIYTGGIVSAGGNINCGSQLTVNGNANLLGITSTASDVIVSGSVFATGVVSASKIYFGVGVVSALGTTQAAAAPLSFSINRGKGVTDGQTTGYRTVSNNAGLVQYLYNEGASANLWPPTGGTINGLAANAAFAIAASSMITIVHLTASAMAAK